MALVHVNATISPSKMELARLWLGTTDWFESDPAGLRMGSRYSYRFDDPTGEVGVEVLLIGDADRVLQVPLTYRSAELAGAEAHFLTHMEHSVLGQRWIYFGLGDAVLVNALIRAAVTGGRQENFEVEVDGRLEVFPALVEVHGTGSAAAPPSVQIDQIDRDGSTTRVHTAAGVLVLPHVAGEVDLLPSSRPGLVGTWPDSGGEIPLAAVEALHD